MYFFTQNTMSACAGKRKRTDKESNAEDHRRLCPSAHQKGELNQQIQFYQSHRETNIAGKLNKINYEYMQFADC